MEDKIFDFDVILELLRKKWWVLILVTALITGLGYYKASQMQISYRASEKIFVGKSENLMKLYDEKEMTYYKEFMNTFNEVIRIDDFLIETLKKHNLSVSPYEVKYALGFSASENTPIFTVNYNSNREEGAAEILTAVCEEFIEQANTIFPGTKPKILDSAKVYPIYPNKTRVIKIYFAAGFVLSLAVILIWDYLDNTVKTKKKLEKLIPVPVLGEVPKHERGFKEGKI